MKSPEKRNSSLFTKKIIVDAILASFVKLNPVTLIKNPVIFIVAIGSLFTSIIVLFEIAANQFSPFNFQISLWLWFTVLFANFSEAIAEGRGKSPG